MAKKVDSNKKTNAGGKDINNQIKNIKAPGFGDQIKTLNTITLKFIEETKGITETLSKAEKDLSQKVADLETQLQEKTEQNSKLESDVVEVNLKVKNLSKANKDLDQKIDKLGTQLLEKDEQNSKLESDIDKVKLKVKNLNKTKKELNQKVADLETQLQEKGEQNSKLESDIDKVNLKAKNLSKSKKGLSQKITKLETKLREKDERNLKLESDIDEVNIKVETLSKDKNDLKQKVTDLDAQLQEQAEQNSELKSEISEANNKIENLSKEIDRLNEDIGNADKRIGEFRIENENLKDQIKNEKEIIAKEWARELVGMLRKVSNLAEREPQNTQGLTPRAVYEDLLTWMEKAFSEKPRPFPVGETIELDASSEDILELKSKYDWGVETPFADNAGKKTFRIIQRGWQLKSGILIAAMVAAEKPDSEINHE